MFAASRTAFAIIVLLVSGTTAATGSSLQAIDEAIAIADYDRALELIDSHLAQTPGDVALRVRRARVHGYVGNDDSALHDLDELRDEYPHDVDYALARARVLVRLGRDRDALDDLREATQLAPNYEEVWKLLYTLLTRRPDAVTRLERESVAHEAASRFPRATWWQTAASESDPHWTILAGADYENLDNDLPSWNRQFLEISRELTSRGRYRAGLSRDQRFDTSDLTVSVGGDIDFATGWTAGLDVSFAEQADFQPDHGFDVHVGRSFEDGWAGSLRYRWRDYATATVGSATAGVEKYIGDFRIAYALGLSHLHGESNSLSHALTINWYYSDRSSVGISVNSGDETESIGPGQVLETPVRGAAVTGRREISERLSLHWWLGLHEQGDYYRRQYFGMAASIRL